MIRHPVLLASIVAIAAVMTAGFSQANQFTPLTRINHLTFSQAAALPGVTLAPGTYVFEAGPGNTNSNIVRVMSKNRQTQFYMGLTAPVVRPSGEGASIVTFGEAARGEAARILAWYPSGSNQGHQFLYR